MRSLLLTLLSFAAFITGTGAQAQSGCTPSTAREVALLEIVSDSSRFVDECVSVTAPSNGAMMYSGVDGYYLAGPLVGAADEAGPIEGRVIGLYVGEASRWPELWEARATGIVDICSRMSAAFQASSPPGSIVMMRGYCHYTDGPVLRDASIEYLRPLAFERKVGEEQRRRFGTLAITDASWTHYQSASAWADRFLDVIQRGDTAAMLELHGLEEAPRPDEMADVLSATFGSWSAFSRIEEDAEPQRAILATHNVLAGGRDFAMDEYRALLCFCVEGDCSDRWPIWTFDADNASMRPYACTEIASYREDAGAERYEFTTVLTPYVRLVEPSLQD